MPNSPKDLHEVFDALAAIGQQGEVIDDHDDNAARRRCHGHRTLTALEMLISKPRLSMNQGSLQMPWRPQAPRRRFDLRHKRLRLIRCQFSSGRAGIERAYSRGDRVLSRTFQTVELVTRATLPPARVSRAQRPADLQRLDQRCSSAELTKADLPAPVLPGDHQPLSVGTSC